MTELGAPRLPPPVRPGDRVGVAALSGPVDGDRLAEGLEVLRGLGYEPALARNLGTRAGLFAGTDGERLGAFHELASDPEIKAIFFARGGHGLLRILPDIDWQLLGAHPRAYIGYSDLTPLLIELVRRLGLVTFHGPMVATDLARGLTGGEAGSLCEALAGQFPRTLAVKPLRPGGPAEGMLLGGCLSMLVATLGTPFAPDLRGCLLFLEDVDEPLYRLDRMLTHLRLSGNLAGIGGMLVGSFGHSGSGEEVAWLELLAQGLEEYPWPLVHGVASGHGQPNFTLPLGLTARLEEGSHLLILGRHAGA